MEARPVIDNDEGIIYPKDTAFEVLLHSRFVKKAGDEPVVELSFQPEYSSGPFTIRLDISPAHILDYGWREDWADWFGYAMQFIDRFSIEHGPFSFEIADDLIIPGDLFGTTSAFTGSFDPHPSLMLLTRYEGRRISNVLSFSDMALEDDAGYFAVATTFQPFDWPARLSAGVLAAMDYDRPLDGVLYPQMSIRLPMVHDEDFDFSFDLSAALRLDGMHEGLDGWGIGVTMPLSYRQLSFDIGISYTNGALHYGQYLNGYETGRVNDSTLMFHSSMLYEGRDMSVILDAQLPLDPGSGRIVEREDYFSLEISADLFSVDIGAGIRMTGFFTDTQNAFSDRGQAFISLGYSNQVLSTTLSLYFTENLEPQVALSATLGAYDALFSRSGDLATSPSWLDLSLQTGYRLDSDASVLVMPIIRFDFEQDITFALRLPLELSTSENRLVIVTGDDDPWFDFGIGQDTTQDMIADLFTDLFTLVEDMRFGNLSSSIYFIAQRQESPLPDLFDMYRPYGGRQGLSLNTGFNLPAKASVNLYVDNLENPRIYDLSISMKPMGEGGPEVTGEVAFETGGDDDGHDLLIAPQLSISQSMLDDRLSLSLFLNTYITLSDEGMDVNIFSSDDLEFASGLSMEASFGHLRIPLSIGVSAGRAREHYWDEFSWRDSLSLDANAYLEEPTFFLHAGAYYASEMVTAGFEYSVDSFPSLMDKGVSQDRLRLVLSFQMNDFSITAMWSRRNLAGSIADIGRPLFWSSADNLYSLTISKTFGHLGLYASFYLDRDDEDPEHTSPGILMMTSLRF